VLFGVTGDLARKMIFPALYAVAKRATSRWPASSPYHGAWRSCRTTLRTGYGKPAGSTISGRMTWKTAAFSLCRAPAETAAATPFRRLGAAGAGPAEYPRFRLSPNSAVALAARVKRVGKEFVGDQRELYLVDHQPSQRGRTSGS
jgi:glucose-6-phosphate dehydrogenase-like protein